MKTILVKSEDNSHTIFSSEFNEHYHSVHGAINESKHIFIEAGFNQINKIKINILEIGFGTGLNAIITLLEAKKSNKKIHYTGIEKFPLDINLISKLNYPELLKINKTDFLKLHKTEWNKKVLINNHFTLHKILGDITEINFNSDFDLIYFDAFSPETQAQLWEYEIFQKIFNNLTINGILTTYSAKGTVKRILKEIGFFVEHIPGPKGKRVITRAIKKC